MKNGYKTININGKSDEVNTIILKWNIFNGYLSDMFKNIPDIIETDLSKLNSSIIGMPDTFFGCSSLKFANLSNLDISQVTNMGHLFADCISLTSVDFFIRFIRFI
jgi:surface protein